MTLIAAENVPSVLRKYSILPIQTALLFALWFAGCNNTCFTFNSNPPTGTIGVKVNDPNSTCNLLTTKGAIRVQIGTGLACEVCSRLAQIQHVFVSVRGVEVRAATAANDDSLDWQELGPKLVKQPQQIDLVRDPADGPAPELIDETAAIPTGIYRQLRLRFVPNQPPTDDALPERNGCGSAGFNCVVMANGDIQPLQLDATSELRITFDRIEERSLLVLPDTNTDLIIELEPVWTWFSPAAGEVSLRPALNGTARARRVELREPSNPAVRDSSPR